MAENKLSSNVEDFLDRNENLLLIYITASLISAFLLSYQTWSFYTSGTCGCPGTPLYLSNYSQIFGVPISLIGLVGMLSYAFLGFLLFRAKPIILMGQTISLYTILLVLFFLNTIGLGIVIYLMYLSYVILKSVCELCFVSQIVTIVDWVIAFNLTLSVTQLLKK